MQNGIAITTLACLLALVDSVGMNEVLAATPAPDLAVPRVHTR